MYLKENAFFDTSEERKEEITGILLKDRKFLDFSSFALCHESIYNPPEFNVRENLLKNLNYMDRFLYFEHFFFWFNEYFQLHQTTLNTIMCNSGLLSQTWKYYIAIMAVSTMKNEFLMRILEEQFLFVGGEEAWLIGGLNAVPNKLKSLSTINDILAHQPSKITAKIINELKKTWSLNLLTEALIVMIQFHKVSLIEDCTKLWKNLVENLNNSGNASGKELLNSLESGGANNLFQEDLIRKVQEIQNEEESKENSIRTPDLNTIFDKNEFKQESFQSVETDGKDYYSRHKEDLNLFDNIFSKHLSKDYDKYYSTGPERSQVLSHIEYNWEDNGYSQLKSIEALGIDCLDEEISYITKISSGGIACKSDNLIGTIHIKRAIIYYIEKLYGYTHGDYNYANISKLLSGNVKYTKYIKKFCFSPKKMSSEEFNEMNKIFKHEETMHIILLSALIKAKMQLTYVAKAINEVRQLSS